MSELEIRTRGEGATQARGRREHAGEGKARARAVERALRNAMSRTIPTRSPVKKLCLGRAFFVPEFEIRTREEGATQARVRREHAGEGKARASAVERALRDAMSRTIPTRSPVKKLCLGRAFFVPEFEIRTREKGAISDICCCFSCFSVATAWIRNDFAFNLFMRVFLVICLGILFGILV